MDNELNDLSKAPHPGIIKQKFLIDKKYTGTIGKMMVAYDPENQAGGFLNFAEDAPCWLLFTPISPDDFDRNVFKVTQWQSEGMAWSRADKNNLKKTH
jgi:hypothetical protein